MQIYILRKATGALYVPSTTTGRADLASMTATRDHHGAFYFRRIVWQPGCWWLLEFGRWVENGETWTTNSADGWDVLLRADLKRFQR